MNKRHFFYYLQSFKCTGLCLSLLMTSHAMAEGPQSQQSASSPYFLVKSPEADLELFPLKETRVHGNVAGVIAEFEVQQTYRNNSKIPIEATYIFPASTSAAIHSMKISVADRVTEATIGKREEARLHYQEAKKSGYTTALLEEQRANIFTMDVGNILPGEEVKVTFMYSELLKPEDGTYQLVYPTVVGPRYVSEDNKEKQVWNNNPYLAEGEISTSSFLFDLDITSPIDIARLNSQSHKLKTSYKGPKQVHVEIAEDEQNRDNHDIIIDYQLAAEAIQSGLSLYQAENENFFLLQVEPPLRTQATSIVPREYIFIIDTSGSMMGFPLSISQKLIAGLLGNLRPSDKFNIMFFAGSNWSYAAESVPANANEINQALAALRSVQAAGSTELLPALKQALSIPKPEGFSRSFVIATDGYVTIEPDAFELVRSGLGSANFFPFGIGTSVNRALMEGLAHAGKSESFIVTSETDANVAVGKFRQYIESPLLTETGVTSEDFEIMDVEPSVVPDLLATRPITIIGKWKGQARGSIIVKGRAANGIFEKKFDVSAMLPSPQNHPLTELWARERVRLLADYFDLSKRSDIAEEITELGLKYQLVTQFTSFLAIDSLKRSSEGSINIRQPLPLPLGVSKSAIGSGFSGRIATSAFTSSGQYSEPVFNDDRITNSFDRVLTFMEGSFGALAMVAFGLASIICALAAGLSHQRKYQVAAGVFLILTISVFFTRSFISTFFNTSISSLL